MTPRRGNPRSAITGRFASVCGISVSPRSFAEEESVEHSPGEHITYLLIPGSGTDDQAEAMGGRRREMG